MGTKETTASYSCAADDTQHLKENSSASDSLIGLTDSYAKLKPMFQQEADWKSATTLICQILRGSARLSIETFISLTENGERQSRLSSWSYDQTQSHHAETSADLKLFSPKHLEGVLATFAKPDISLVYEVHGARGLRSEVEGALSAFSKVNLSLVMLAVGDVTLSWVLVTLLEPRDLILWKMRYHLRDVPLSWLIETNTGDSLIPRAKISIAGSLPSHVDNTSSTEV